MHGHMFVKSLTTATDQYPMDRVRGLTPQSLILNLQWLFWTYFFFCKYSILMIFGILNQLSSQTSVIYLAHLSHLSTNTALRYLSSFPWPHCQTAVPWPFLCLSSHPLPSWHHHHQTPSLCPFRADVVLLQIQMSQTGVLFQGLGQSLAGGKRFEKHDEAHSTHRKQL